MAHEKIVWNNVTDGSSKGQKSKIDTKNKFPVGFLVFLYANLALVPSSEKHQRKRTVQALIHKLYIWK